MQEAIGLVFREFAEFESIRQVRQEQVLLPSVETAGELRRGRLGRIVWKLPVDNSGRGLLTNPVYGGAYAFGRTASRVTVENGRKRVSRGRDPDRKEWRDRKEWDVLIVDHHAAAGCGVPPRSTWAAPHAGYVSWAAFERNQRLIADNTSCRGQLPGPDGARCGAPR